MNTLDILRETKKYPTFNLSTFSNIINKDTSYAKLFLYRLKKRNLVHQIQRDVYTTYDDPFLIASRIIWPSYISLWSAFRYYHLTEQNPQVIFVITTRKKRKNSIRFMHTTILFDYIKPKYFFGYRKERYNDFEIFIAEPEKALLDAVLLKKISLSEIYSILKENIATIQIEKLINFVNNADHSCLSKRIGWMLDTLGFDHHKALNVTDTYLPLEYAKALKGIKNKKWKVVENMEVL